MVSASASAVAQERLHDWSLRYLRLKIMVLVLRSLNSLRPLVHRNRPPLPHAFERHVVDIPSRDQNRTIRAHIYRSKRVAPSSDGVAAPLPVHITWHGSGFVLPNLGDDYAFIAHVLEQLGRTASSSMPTIARRPNIPSRPPATMHRTWSTTFLPSPRSTIRTASLSVAFRQAATSASS